MTDSEELRFTVHAAGMFTVRSTTFPEPIRAKYDPRGEPVTQAEVLAVDDALASSPSLDGAETSVIAVTPTGCREHLDALVRGIEQRVPRPGDYVRVGPHLVAGSVAMAIGAHGPVLTLVGEGEALSEGWRLADELLHNKLAETFWLVAVDLDSQPAGSAALLLGQAGSPAPCLVVDPRQPGAGSATGPLASVVAIVPRHGPVTWRSARREHAPPRRFMPVLPGRRPAGMIRANRRSLTAWRNVGSLDPPGDGLSLPNR